MIIDTTIQKTHPTEADIPSDHLLEKIIELQYPEASEGHLSLLIEAIKCGLKCLWQERLDLD